VHEGVRGPHHQGGRIEAAKLRTALEDIEIESVKGKVHIRKCDHQGVQQGFMVEGGS